LSANSIPFSGTTLDAPACTAWRGADLRSAYRHGLVVRYPGRKLFEYDLAYDAVKGHDLPVMSSVLARVDDGPAGDCHGDRAAPAHVATGELELITPIEAENPTTRSNDGRVHPCGALWIGTMGKSAEKHAGAIYHVARGTVTTLSTRHHHSQRNLLLARRCNCLFHRYDHGTLMRVAIDPETALPTGSSQQSSSITVAATAGSMARCVMRDGVVWNARWGAGCIDGYSADGERVVSLKVPASQIELPRLRRRRG
jgi:sugar lactone lactonase YvrE